MVESNEPIPPLGPEVELDPPTEETKKEDENPQEDSEDLEILPELNTMKRVDSRVANFPDDYLNSLCFILNEGSNCIMDRNSGGYVKQVPQVGRAFSAWTITKEPGGRYAIRTKSTGYSLVVYPNHHPWLNVDDAYDRHGYYSNSLWKFEPASNGCFYLMNQSYTGERIDVHNDSRSAATLKINPYIAHKNEFQQWWFYFL